MTRQRVFRNRANGAAADDLWSGPLAEWVAVRCTAGRGCGRERAAGRRRGGMELRLFRYFLAACDTLNYGRAAALCGVSQPALTRAIQKLEGEFGGAFFRRKGNRMQLTALGRLLRPRLQKVLENADAAKVTADAFAASAKAPRD